MKTQFSQIGSLIFFVFVSLHTLTAQSAVYDFFSTNGLAGPTATPPCYLLTDSDPGSAGAGWINYALTNNPAYVIDLSASNVNTFDQSFQLFFDAKNFAGADGIAFVIADTASSRLAAPGQGIGYGQGNSCGPTAGNCFIDNSIAFEIDTHPNPAQGDPNDDHIALQLNGVENHNDPNNSLALVSIADVEDGLIHEMRIRIIPQGSGNFQFDFFLDDPATPKITQLFTAAQLANIFPDPSTVIWGFTASNGGLTATQKFGQDIVCSTAAFPVEWVYFDATLKIDNSIQLDWGTTNEENNQGFEVEKMTAEGWEVLGNLAPVASQEAINNYTFTDFFPQAGFNVYRIRQLDIDGKSSFSPLVELFIEPSNSLVRIFPNPADSYFSLQLPSDQMEGDMTLAYYDLKGQEVYRQTVSISLGEGYLKTNTPTLAAGVYMVELQRYRQRLMPPARLILR